jgi:DNA-binding ferritin-like protein
MKTLHNKFNKNKNKRNISGGRRRTYKTGRQAYSKAYSTSNKTIHAFEHFQKEITLVFFEILLMIKLYHWKTHSYATHKATDELYTTFNGHMDKFIEVLLGKTGTRIDLNNVKSVKLDSFDSQEGFKQKVEEFKGYLVGLENHNAMKTMSNTDLFNIRDEILSDLNQFLYLLTFR